MVSWAILAAIEKQLEKALQNPQFLALLLGQKDASPTQGKLNV